MNYKKKIVSCAYYTKGKNLFIYGKNILGGKIKKIDTLKYTSYGIGQIINANLDKKKIYVSLGGSLNTDAGLGFLQSIGAKFIFKKKIYKKVLTGEDLDNIKKVHINNELKKKLKKIHLTLISDSDIYPVGSNGQSFVFGSQKKLNFRQIKIHDKNIKKFCKILFKKKKLYYIKYLGAGGAIGVAMKYIFNTKVISGSKFFFNKLSLNKKLKKIDTLISTEGQFDRTSFFGKGFEFLKNISLKKKLNFLYFVGKSEMNFDKKGVQIINFRNRCFNKKKFKKSFLNNFDNFFDDYEKKTH